MPIKPLVNVTVDTGIGWGIAVWSCKHWHRRCSPVRTFLYDYRRNTGRDWAQGIEASMKEFRCALSAIKLRWGSRLGYIEYPIQYDGEKGRQMALRGDLVKLAYATGRQAEALTQEGFHVAHIQPRQWKGTLSKQAVAARVSAALDLDDARTLYKSHVLDAVGIGLWLKKMINQDTIMDHQKTSSAKRRQHWPT